MVEGMVSKFRRELGAEAKVIATGEQISLVVAETKIVDIVDEQLTLRGLKLIYDLNRPKKP
jgi:type III pantothenate kinase